jgi:hypothetical protein
MVLKIELAISSIHLPVKSGWRASGIETGIETFLALNAYLTFYVVKTIWRKRRFNKTFFMNILKQKSITSQRFTKC